MDINYLKTLKVITESGSFAEAADKLQYTRSTVTFQIQQLEKEFGVALFEKIGKHMYLTEAGKNIIPYVDSILRSYDQILICSRTEVAHLRIAVPDSLLTYRFQPVISAFRKKMPQVDLQIQTQSCYNMNRLLLGNDIDVAIHYDVQLRDPNIISTPVSQYDLVFFGSPQLTKEERDFTTPHQIKSFGLIDIEIEGLYRHSLDALLKEKDITLAQSMVLGSIDAIIQCTRMGLGVSVLPDFAVKKELADGTLINLGGRLSPAKVSVMSSYHRYKRISPAMQYFLELAGKMI